MKLFWNLRPKPKTVSELKVAHGEDMGQFSAASINKTVWRFDAKLPNTVWQHVGRGLVFRGSITPHPKGTGTQRSPIWGILSIYAYTLCPRTTKFDLVRHMGRGLVFRGQPRPPPEGGGASALPNFGVLYLCLRPLSRTTKFDMVTHMGRRILGDQPRHSICTNASRGLSSAAEFRS